MCVEQISLLFSPNLAFLLLWIRQVQVLAAAWGPWARQLTGVYSQYLKQMITLFKCPPQPVPVKSPPSFLLIRNFLTLFMLLRIFSCDLVEYCLSFLSSFML